MMRLLVRLLVFPKVAKWVGIFALVFVLALLGPGLMAGRPWLLPSVLAALGVGLAVKIARRRKRKRKRRREEPGIEPGDGPAGDSLEHRR